MAPPTVTESIRVNKPALVLVSTVAFAVGYAPAALALASGRPLVCYLYLFWSLYSSHFLPFAISRHRQRRDLKRITSPDATATLQKYRSG